MLGIKAALEASSDGLGKVIVLGTPAEEGGGGKIKMIENGCFDDVDFCMMVHPKSFNCVYPPIKAKQSVSVTYHGFLPQGGVSQWEGVNALDAAVLAYNSLSMLRQQLPPSWRLHGIISDGGTKPNVIPGKSSLSYYFRAPTEEELKVLCEKSEACIKAAAQATGKQNNRIQSLLLAELFGVTVITVTHQVITGFGGFLPAIIQGNFQIPLPLPNQKHRV